MRTLLFAAAFAAVSTCALAADLKGAPLPTKAAPLPPLYDPYTGVYAGGTIGYGWDRGKMGASFPTGPGDFGDLSNSPQGFLGGGYLGVGTRIPGLLSGLGLDGYVGAEGMGLIGDLSGTAATPGGFAATTKDRWLARAAGRLGLIYQNVMLFGSAGVGWGSTDMTVTGDNSTGGALLGSSSKTESGFTWSLGVEFPWFFGPQWKFRAEYVQFDFGTNGTCIFSACDVVVTQKNRIDAGLVGLNFKF